MPALQSQLSCQLLVVFRTNFTGKKPAPAHSKMPLPLNTLYDSSNLNLTVDDLYAKCKSICDRMTFLPWTIYDLWLHQSSKQFNDMVWAKNWACIVISCTQGFTYLNRETLHIVTNADLQSFYSSYKYTAYFMGTSTRAGRIKGVQPNRVTWTPELFYYKNRFSNWPRASVHWCKCWFNFDMWMPWKTCCWG